MKKVTKSWFKICFICQNEGSTRARTEWVLVPCLHSIRKWLKKETWEQEGQARFWHSHQQSDSDQGIYPPWSYVVSSLTMTVSASKGYLD